MLSISLFLEYFILCFTVALMIAIVEIFVGKVHTVESVCCNNV
jgi:hypothetical protein